MKTKNRFKTIIVLALLIFSLFGCTQKQSADQRGTIDYHGKTYALTSKHIFGYFHDLGFRTGEKTQYLNNCKLEYTGSGNLKYFKENGNVYYYALDDHFIIKYDNNEDYFFSKVWLYTDKSLTPPDFTAENISEIRECIGVPRFAGYDEFFESDHQAKDYTMNDVYTEFLYDSKSINDPVFIKKFTDEVKKSGSVKALADEAIKLNEDTVKKAQEKYNSQSSVNEKISVYYKVCFKDNDFPFRLIFTF